MKLIEAQASVFRSIRDFEKVEPHRDVTRLVGGSESGKTALLQVLYRLKATRQRPLEDAASLETNIKPRAQRA